jgi:hypothetical protein
MHALAKFRAKIKEIEEPRSEERLVAFNLGGFTLSPHLIRQSFESFGSVPLEKNAD